MRPKQIHWLTDFGSGSPYLGQIEALLRAQVPDIPVINLLSDLEPFRPDLAAYLTPRLISSLPPEILYVCVVDPGVGSERAILAMHVGSNWFLGPDNGLLSIVMRDKDFRGVYRVNWPWVPRSASFHGRDVFVPLVVSLLVGKREELVPTKRNLLVGAQWPDDLEKVVYKDSYGNVMTGLRASALSQYAVIKTLSGVKLKFARTFSEVAKGACFWYENAFGLVEIAINQGSAGDTLGLKPGDAVIVEED